MEGKRRRIASFADTGGPRAPLRSNFDDPEGWDTSISEEECSQQDVVQRMVPVAGRPIIMCCTSGCSGSFSLSAVESGYEAGKKPDFPAPERYTVKHFTLPCIDGQVWFPGATHRAIKRYQKVWRQSWRTARNLIRLGTKCWVNSLGVKWKQHRRPLWAPVRPASRCRILLVSLLQVSTPLSLVGLLAHFLLVQSIPRVDCVETSWIRRSGVGDTCSVLQHAQQAGIFLFGSCGHK